MRPIFMISNSVGGTGRNKPIDVMVVQHLLNLNYDVLDYLAPITGIPNYAMIQAIKCFQQNVLGMKKPNGRVDPYGMTWLWLSQLGLSRSPLTTARKPCGLLRPVIGASRQARVATRPDEASSTLSIINDVAFLRLYDLQFGTLSVAQRAGLTKLIEYLNADLEVQDVGWGAYILATVKYECKNKWEPVREPSRGAWFPYGRPAPYTDSDGQTYANTYYGRGYIPLTW
jgi:hypothetical protein